MPCYDERNSWEYINAENQAKLDKLTRLLCEACKEIEATNPTLNGASVELREWWVTHKRLDIKRSRAEERRRAAQRNPHRNKGVK